MTPGSVVLMNKLVFFFLKSDHVRHNVFLVNMDIFIVKVYVGSNNTLPRKGR